VKVEAKKEKRDFSSRKTLGEKEGSLRSIP